MFKHNRNTQQQQYTTTWIYAKSPPQINGLEPVNGWHKASIDEKNDPSLNFNSNDVIDLNGWKYYQEVPILEHREIQSLPDDDESLAMKEEEQSTLLGSLTG